ncbi:MAG: hypothetical protein NTW21_08100 [Verrucomicrobia bacterium]|nr:hypothetical protein [Verrucomicrobiota bacterium]
MALAAFVLTNPSAHAQTVWNVNFGGSITTSDNYVGAAPENTPNSTWNAVTSSQTGMALVDSTGSSAAGVTLDQNIGGTGGWSLTSGDKIFVNYIGGGLVNMTIKGLNPTGVYDIVIYSDWYWTGGDSGYPVTQTVGTGLTGTIYVNHDNTHANGAVPPLAQDTNPANVNGATNWYRITGLTPDASGHLGFGLGGGVNAPCNGFQLIEHAVVVDDTDPPTPNPMTWASTPAAVSGSSTSIAMTATTASDANVVEYYFTCTGGGNDSGWQTSPSYTDTGLTPGTSYTYTVTARDKSPAQNATDPSAPASVSTNSLSTVEVWNVNFVNSSYSGPITPSDNYVGAAPENTPNSTWNPVTTQPQTGMVLADSTGFSGTGVTLDLSGPSGSEMTGRTLSSGDKIFTNYFAGGPVSMTIKGLSPSKTYALVIYSDWVWSGTDSGYPVTQTVGTGLTGTIYVNHDNTHAYGQVPPLAQDTNPANVNGATNWYRMTGLTPDASGQLGFRLQDGANAPFNGFQLIEVPVVVADTDPPTPNPMTWASTPAAVSGSSSSITMTATTASDANAVEYYFTETSGNPGATSSDWQTSPSYTDTGLTPGTTYTYTVTARDKSPAQNETAPSDPASASTNSLSMVTVWNVNFGGSITPSDNYVGAAPENTPNSTWNSVTTSPQTAMALADSTGSSAAGVTLDLRGPGIGGHSLTSGDKIFANYIGGLGATVNMTIKGLSPSGTYDLIIYSDWYWNDGNSGYPVTQTVGTGLTGTIYVNHLVGGTAGVLPPLTQDTNPADVNGATNWYRITGLTPDASGHLGFRLGDGANAPVNGFQLIDTTASSGTPYDMWAKGTFANGATLSDKDPAHDPDGDGQNNQQEFAFGLDPTTGSSANPISQPLDKATGVFKYTRTKDSGLNYTYQYSTTLSEPWVAFTPVTDPPLATSISPTVEEVTVEVPAVLLDNNSTLFLRVKAE